MGRCYLSWGFRVYFFLEVQGSCLQLMSDPTFFLVSFRVGISTLPLKDPDSKYLGLCSL